MRSLRLRVVRYANALLVNGEVIALRPKETALAALLIEARGAWVELPAIAGRLWPGHPPADAGGGVRWHVKNLRRRLDHTTVRIENTPKAKYRIVRLTPTLTHDH